MLTKPTTLEDVKGVMNKMQVLREEVNLTISNHYKKGNGNPIPQSKFTDMEIGDKIFFGDSKDNYAELISIGLDKIVFIAINEKGARVREHSHDFHEEMRIIKGELLESVSNKTYVQDDSIRIRPFQLHGFIAEECSIYTVVIKLN